MESPLLGLPFKPFWQSGRLLFLILVWNAADRTWVLLRLDVKAVPNPVWTTGYSQKDSSPSWLDRSRFPKLK